MRRRVAVEQARRAQQIAAARTQAYRIVVEPQRVLHAQALEQRDAEPPGEVAVAGPCPPQRGIDAFRGRAPARRGARDGQSLEQVGDLLIGEAVVAVAPLLQAIEQTTLAQPTQMLAGRGR